MRQQHLDHAIPSVRQQHAAGNGEFVYAIPICSSGPVPDHHNPDDQDAELPGYRDRDGQIIANRARNGKTGNRSTE